MCEIEWGEVLTWRRGTASAVVAAGLGCIALTVQMKTRRWRVFEQRNMGRVGGGREVQIGLVVNTKIQRIDRLII